MKKLLVLPLLFLLQGSTFFHITTLEGSGLKMVSTNQATQAVIQFDGGINQEGKSLLRVQTLSDEWMSVEGEQFLKTVTVGEKFAYQIKVTKGKDHTGAEHYHVVITVQPLSY